ncbi:MAG TPA: DUF1028 domain-containing protein, partial [Beijerinckiaceae bacterium]|nr:DUF1028 domain-containing protein [Beijerinckiaceae bacterium]
MTWSIVARDEASGAMGVAVSTKFFAVGARVPAIEVGAGAMASQALTNPLHRRRGLALLREGVPAQDVIRLLGEPDAGREHRQIHIMDREGRLAAHTGAECVPWCGHLIRDTFSVAGNMLAGPEVIADTARAYEAQAALPFPRRLIAALKAGEAAGGDKRGKQAAALLIYSTEEYSDLDLRVDDHTDPLAELERLEGVSRERWTHFRRFLPNRNDPSGVFDRDVINTEIEKALAAERE